MEKIKDHHVIVNWNEKGPGIIEQLHHPVLKSKRPIIIVSESQVVLPETDAKGDYKHEYEGTYTVIGNPASEATLRRANVPYAKSVIILADDKQRTELSAGGVLSQSQIGKVVDSKSIMIILNIKKVCHKMKEEMKEEIKIPSIIVEILDPSNVKLTEYTGELGNGNMKVVSSSSLGMNLLAQAAICPQMVDIYNDLLTFGEDSNEIYKSEVPKEVIDIGMTRNEFFKWLLDLRDEDINVTPIGIMRDGNIRLNSKKSHLDELKTGDFFFSISYAENHLIEIHKRAKGLKRE